MPAAAPIDGLDDLSQTGAKRRGGGSMPAAALMVDFVGSSRTEAKRRGGGSMPAAAPDGFLGYLWKFSQSAAAVGLWPPRREVQIWI